MGGGNGQKSRMARERNMEKAKGAKGSQLETNKKAMNIQVCPPDPFSLIYVYSLPDSLYLGWVMLVSWLDGCMLL